MSLLSAETNRATLNATNSIQDLDPLQAIKKLRAAPGLKIDLFAPEPLLANPVSFAFDEKGRAFVVETFRRRTSVYNMSGLLDWLDAELSFRTVEDRLSFFQKVLVPENKAIPPAIVRDLNGDGKFDYHDLEVESERIRLLEDRNGDGRAETSVVFAEDFKTAVSGVAAGVFVRRTNVWLTCIPDLWLLRDTNGDGQADFRKSLLHGFGIHIAFGSHDLHGVCQGPDGRIYFSVGDRGFHVETEGRVVASPDSGAVLRCNPDGSGFEIVATGLRNPQELAFDQLGNLWTADNNGDGGDKSRWVYVVEGSDSGWHIGWQHQPLLGLWNAEKLWELPPTNTAAYQLPPVGHVSHGPAGLAFYPGTGLPARFQNHFFLCDFPGGVHSFAVEPKGAAYQLTDWQEFISELLPVDVAFGPEGGAYVADWVEGWEKTGKGRIFRIYDPAALKDSAVAETKKLLAEGMEQRSLRQLGRLLEHPDMRIRQEAQFALAERGDAATNTLAQIAARNSRPLARLHAIWGLGQIARVNPFVLNFLLPLLADPDPEVRGQAAKAVGEGRLAMAYDGLVNLLRDATPRVRFFAAMSLGKLGRPEAIEPLLRMIADNGDRDPFLRHAGVMALVGLKDRNALAAAAKETSASIRMAVLLAMRKLERPEVATFLYDSSPAIVLEAVRAIHDLPLTNGFTQVASLISKPNLSEPVLRRVLNVNFRLGKMENALSLADFAAQPSAPPPLRAEALQLLGQWASPPAKDRLLGLWRPLPARDTRGASLALRSALPDLLKNAPDDVREAAVKTAAQLAITQVATTLFELLSDSQRSPGLRRESLRALAAFNDKRLNEAVALALADRDETLRKEGNLLLSKLKPGDALGQIAIALEKGSFGEKQAALQTLAAMTNSTADQILLGWLDLLRAGKVPKELHFDLLEVAGKRPVPALKERLAQYKAGRSKEDPLAAFRETLYGGDAQAGRKLFFERADLACLRCHKIKGEGGDVGPELTGIGSKQSREYLLESILYPSKTIAPGFETTAVKLKSGANYAGRLKNETEHELLIVSPEEGLIVLGKNQIVSRQRGLSAMPGDVANLISKRDLRDLIEFLAQLK